MFEEKRWIATTIYLVAMGMTLFMAIQVGDVLPVLMCMIVQFFAMLWYSLSYIPFARNAVKSVLKTCCGL